MSSPLPPTLAMQITHLLMKLETHGNIVPFPSISLHEYVATMIEIYRKNIRCVGAALRHSIRAGPGRLPSVCRNNTATPDFRASEAMATSLPFSLLCRLFPRSASRPPSSRSQVVRQRTRRLVFPSARNIVPRMLMAEGTSSGTQRRSWSSGSRGKSQRPMAPLRDPRPRRSRSYHPG